MKQASESVFGRMPLLPGEREYGTLGANSTCFAYGVATWCFLTGGYVAELVPAFEGLVCLVAGNMLGVLLASLPLQSKPATARQTDARLFTSAGISSRRKPDAWPLGRRENGAHWKTLRIISFLRLILTNRFG